MKPSYSLTDGYRELFFGQWMPNLLYERFEADEYPLVEELWDVPVSPSAYLESDPILSIRWQALADSLKEQIEWIPPFFQLPGCGRDPFHPMCRFYNTVTWCENRMIIHVLTEWQEHLELTILKFELITLQNQLVDFLRECDKRLKDSKKNDIHTVKKLSRYLYSLTRDSILILLLEINERFGHLLEERRLGLKQLFIKYLREPVPSTFKWVTTPSRVKWKLERIDQADGADVRIGELLNQVKAEYRQQTNDEEQQLVLDSVHILENAWFLGLVMTGEKVNIGAGNLSKSEMYREKIAEWKELLLTDNPDHTDEEGSKHKEIFHRILNCSMKALNVLDTENESLSEAAELTLLIDDLFSERAAYDLSYVDTQTKNTAADQTGHWLLDQYIPLEMVRDKLGVGKRTMRTYISDYDLPVIEITAKSKWVKADDFQAFMDRFKKKKKSS